MSTKIITLVLLLVSLIGFSNAQVLDQSRPGVPLMDIRGSGISLNLGDDQVSNNIPLGFQFNLFGQTFDSAWVSNNGVISFTNGNISGYNSEPLNTLNSQYNYALFPLWTDLINSSEANPYYKLGENTAIFGWYDSREYSYRESRNSFEVQLWNDNSFEFRYSEINLSNQAFTIGYTGNISQGDYVEWARFDGGGINLQNFSFFSDPVNQCLVNPLYSVTCEGYEQAYLQQQCSINPLYDNRCNGYEQAFLEQACIANPLYSSQCTGYSEAYFQQQCNQNPLYNSQCPGYTTAFALTQNKKPNEPTVVQEIQVDNTKIDNTSVDVGGVELSITGEIAIPNGLPSVVSENIKNEEKASVKILSPRILNIVRNVLEINYSLVDQTIDIANKTNDLENNNTTELFSLSNSINQNYFNEENNNSIQIAQNTQVSNTRQNINVSQTQEQPISETQETKREPIAEFSGGVDINALSQVPADFNRYSSAQLKDNQFYSPREIYRNQQNVDNRNVLRILNGASDRRYQDLIQQQYRSR
jgi:hypothetical protein